MPIYAYRCSRCGEELEVQQSMSDKPLKRCKSCRGALKRVYHPVGIVLKGPGFYKTDYGSSKKSSASRSSESSSSSSSDSSSSDSKASTSSDSSTSKNGSGSSPKGGSSTKAASSSD